MTTNNNVQDELFGYDSKKIDSLCGSFFCNPRNTPYRYFILVLLFLSYASTYFVIELPSGLQITIMEVMNINAKQYNLLFSVYTWPDLILSVFGGILIDRVIGLRAGILLLSLLTLIGQTIFTVGMFINSFPIALAGRIVLGCGIGQLKTVIFVFIALWFKGKELSFISALGTCFTRIGTTLGILAPQPIYDNLKSITSLKSHGLGITSSIGIAGFIFSFVGCCFAVILDKRASWQGIMIEQTKAQKKFNLRDLKDSLKEFSISYWLSTIPLSIFFAILYSYAANGQLFVSSKYGFSVGKANFANSLIFTAPILVTPFLGILMDITGYNIIWSIIGLLFAMATHGSYIVSDSQMFFVPFVAAISYSLSYSIFVTAIYPLPVLLIQEHQLTTAYSLFNLQYCVAFSVISVITGFLIDHKGFLILEVFYILLVCFMLCLIVLLLFIDMGRDTKVLLVSNYCRSMKHMMGRKHDNNESLDNFSHND